MKRTPVLLASLLIAVMPTDSGSVAEAGQPNILFILADDLGIGDLKCYGNPYVETPAIDSLARDGVRLTDHYAPSPLCAPSRAGYLTGRFNHRTGAVDVPSNRGLDRICLTEKTFGDYFRQSGYRTALIGKWHNGVYCRDYLPHRRGFDLFFGFANGGQDYWDWNLLRNDEDVAHDGRYLSDAINDEAIAFIDQSDDRPFAIFLAHHAPHSPYQAPQAMIQKYRERIGDDASPTVAILYAMIEAMDTGLARVFEHLKTAGQWDNTIIVFTSDNGAYLTSSGGTAATMRYHAGYSGNKGDVGEQGIRVPAIVVWPNNIPAGRTIHAPVHGCDWLPTLYSVTDAAAKEDQRRPGIPPGTNRHENKPLDGQNVMPLLRGEPSSSIPTRLLPFQKNRYVPVAHSDAAIRRDHWKLVWPSVPFTMRKDSARDNPSYLRGIVNKHWEMPMDRVLAEFTDVPAQKPRLFDLAADPTESHDLADQHPQLVAELSRSYDAWFAEVMDDWKHARRAIVQHDQDYWRNRPIPDAKQLFKGYWQWKHAPDGTDPTTADPLEVFRGFWSVPTNSENIP